MLLRDIVKDRIRDAILSGTLQPGEPLNDKKLQEWLGVSRTPIRDAVNELAATGLVEVSANRYTRVAIPDPALTPHALDVAALLLTAVVERATPRLSAPEVDELVGSLEHLRDLVRMGEIRRMRTAARELFALLAAACGNPYLRDICLVRLDSLAFALNRAPEPPAAERERLEGVFDAFARGIAEGDAAAAGAAAGQIFAAPVG